MRSSRAGLARPVRTAANSCWVDSSDVLIRSRASSSRASIISAAIVAPLLAMYQGAHTSTRDYACDVGGVVHVEDVDRHAVLHAERKCGGVHHAQATLDRLHVGYLGDELCGGVERGVGAVDAFDALLGHEDDLGVDLRGAQGGGGVGS